MKRRKVLLVALAAIGLLCLGVGSARADDCVALGGNLVAAECVIDGSAPGTPPNNRSGSFSIGETLHITGTGIITVLQPGITIEVTAGDFVMDSGAEINADSAGGCDGGNKGASVTIQVDAGSLFPAYAVDLKTGSYIHSNSCSGGDIVIKALNQTGGAINIDGTVESVGSISGTGAVQPPGGGTITIIGFCKLLVSDTGLISSRGGDPGADLVHLEACVVEVDGKVESTGPGHAIPNSPTNHCYYQIAGFPSPPQTPPNPADDPQNPRPDKSPFSTACVEIWAGTTLTINSTLPHNGQVNADTGSGGGNNGTSWIDLFAHGDISIIGDSRAFFAVHANDNDGSGGTGSQGGLVEVLTTGGKVSASGHALQANGNPNSGGADGGIVKMDADQDLDLTGGTVEAKGSDSGTDPHGGEIDGRAWNGAILADAATFLDVSGGNPADGVINLTACGAIAVTAANTSAGSTLNSTSGTCGGDPAPPSYVTLPAPDCFSRCGTTPPPGSKSGRKFDSTTLNGLNGWTIHLFGTLTATGAPVHQTFVTKTATAAEVDCTLGAPGCYDFQNLLPGTYHVCEQLLSGWSQTFPTGATIPPAGETIFNCAGPPNPDPGPPPAGPPDNPTPGPNGYTFTITPTGEHFPGDDFGNQINCQKQPVQAVLNPNTGQYPGNKGPDYVVRVNHGESVQAAVDAAAQANGDVNNDGYLIIQVLAHDDGSLGGSAAQTVQVSATYAKPFALIGCSVTLNGASPAIVIASSASDPGLAIPESAAGNSKIFLMDLHGTGIKVDGDHRYLRNEYGNGSAAAGFLITGSFNTMHNGAAIGNAGDGVHVEGNSNLLTDTNSFNNGGDGLDVAGNSNILSKNVAGDKGKGNSGAGLRIFGASNSLTQNTATANRLDGFTLSGALTSATANLLKNNVSNTGNAGDASLENGGMEFRLANFVKNNGGGNKADGNITVPKTTSPTKCTTFPGTNVTSNASIVCE